MHGKVHNPQAVRTNDLGEGREVLTITTGVVAVGSLEGPATIGLRLDLESLVGSLPLTISSEGSGSVGGQVLAAVSVMGSVTTHGQLRYKAQTCG